MAAASNPASCAATSHMGAVNPPSSPCARLSVGITGHRETNAEFMARRAEVEAALAQVLDAIDAAVAAEHASCSGTIAATRLCSLLADGADQMAATAALERGWQLLVPLPFGRRVNVAINTHPQTVAEAEALLVHDWDAGVVSEAVRQRALVMQKIGHQAQIFELAERDEFIARLYLEKMRNPDDRHAASVFAAESSARVALAGRVLVEQSDILIAVWDGASYSNIGGTGHTVLVALEAGAPVVWIDARAPQGWRILSGPEALADLESTLRESAEPVEELRELVYRALVPVPGRKIGTGHEALAAEAWPEHSRPVWHAYRRIEALFGAETWRARLRNLVQTYETPDQIVTGSGAVVMVTGGALPGIERRHVEAIGEGVLRRFAWADGVSAWLSDVYRGGMTANFILAALAIVGGIAYLPFVDPHHKWPFATFELLTLVFILAVTAIGQKRRWHGRWFETRRVAEYLRHAPILLLLGVTRAPGRWPRGTDTSWPEWCARHAIREVGLPHVAVTEEYLRMALRDLLHKHVVMQRDYHIGKARRLSRAHHNLDHLSERLFQLAILCVGGYLVLKAGGVLHLWPKSLSEHSSMVFTFLGVLLPTFGGAIAGIRYFGDFERFAAISRITAEKLQNIHVRIERLLRAPPGNLDYGQVADLAHATDDVVVSEIESWQAVFGGKQVSVPV